MPATWIEVPNRPLGAIDTDRTTTLVGNSQDVQRLKLALNNKAPRTVNNVLAGLSAALKRAVAWGVINMPCTIKLLKAPRGPANLLVRRVRTTGAGIKGSFPEHLIMPLSGEAGLGRSEMMAMEWTDVGHQLGVARSECKGKVTVTKGGRIRYVPMTTRLAAA